MKTIIFCADGTWNGPGQVNGDGSSVANTNVFKLFTNLDGHDTSETSLLAKEQERVLTDASGSVVQWAKYLHGVGDSGNFLVRLLGGTIGAGLITRIVRGYTFISRNYVPGDAIIIVGFSRGAYTARALAGLIASMGLLDATRNDLDDKDNGYRLGSAVWRAYRQKALADKPQPLQELRERLLDLPSFFSADRLGPLIDAEIEAVAVWDTVGSYGIPTFNLRAERIDAFQFADLILSPKVKHGFHAISVDEQREDFVPTLWEADQRIVQVLCPGAHSDVGGGYPVTNDESGLSDWSLAWMAGELAELGVQFARVPRYVGRPLATGPSHAPWTRIPWTALQQNARKFCAAAKLGVARSLVDRHLAPAVRLELDGTPGRYSPTNLASYMNGTEVAEGVPIIDVRRSLNAGV